MRGDGRVFQRQSIWWIAYYDQGKERRESSGSRQRKEAVRLLRQRVGEIAAGATHAAIRKRARSRKLTMEDLFDLAERHYLLGNHTSPANLVYLRMLRRRFGSYTVKACDALVISHYMAERHRTGRTPETINREMAVLRTAFRLAREHDLYPRTPFIKRLPQLGVRNEYFTRAEIDMLLPCLPEYLRDPVLFGFLTGWRKGEIAGLQWNNVDRSGEVIRLDPTQNKGRDVRVLPLEGEVAAIIERRRRVRVVNSGLIATVFHRAGHPLDDFRKAWLRACKEAGLGHRKFHSLRRAAARNMSLQGIPEKVIMLMMGHKTRTMFDRYNIMTEADQRVYAKRLFGP